MVVDTGLKEKGKAPLFRERSFFCGKEPSNHIDYGRVFLQATLWFIWVLRTTHYRCKCSCTSLSDLFRRRRVVIFKIKLRNKRCAPRLKQGESSEFWPVSTFFGLFVTEVVHTNDALSFAQNSSSEKIVSLWVLNRACH